MTIYAEFEDAISHLQDLEIDLTKILSFPGNRDVLNRLYDEINKVFDSAQSAYNKLRQKVRTKTPIVDGKELQFAEINEKFLVCRRTYGYLSKEIEESRNKYDKPAVSKSTTCNSGEGELYQSLHLPACDIALFDGQYLNWPTFRDLFTAVFIKNKRLDPVRKLYHLLQKTKGEANDICKRAPLTNEGFQQAWNELGNYYENKRIFMNKHLDHLFNIPAVKIESAENIKKLQRDYNACLAALESINVSTKEWDPILVNRCTKLLPIHLLTLWEQSVKNTREMSTWAELDKFLIHRYETLINISRESSTSGVKRATNNSLQTFQIKVQPMMCAICQESHVTWKCSKLLDMTISDRRECVKKAGLCFVCLSKLHNAQQCKSKYSCRKCKQKHNSLLHLPMEQQPVQSTMMSNNNLNNNMAQESPKVISETSLSATASISTLLNTAMVNIDHNGVRYLALALLDHGSQDSFITERLVNLLGLPRYSTNYEFSGLNCTPAAKSSDATSVVMSRRNPLKKVKIETFIIPSITKPIPSTTINANQFKNLPNYYLADPFFNECGNIDFLIGGEVIPSIICIGKQNLVCGSLLAQESIFGWLIFGPVSDVNIEETTCNSLSVNLITNVNLNEQLRSFWELEAVPGKGKLSEEERACEEIYCRTTRRQNDGRYIVSLPFKVDIEKSEGNNFYSPLGTSRHIALKRFQRLEKRFQQDQQYCKEYGNVFMDYVKSGHVKLMDESGVNQDNKMAYYLPHHGVLKPSSTTTKLRIVFDASCKSSNGKSLNDLLYTGPALQNDIVKILIQWRFHQYVFSSDISQMYRQILIAEDHTRFQRILFRDHNGELKDWELKTVTFGVNSAPYLAIRTLLQLADDQRKHYPIASEIITNNMYVDDVLYGCNSVELLHIAKKQLIECLGSGGFPLRKWSSNSMDLLQTIANENRLREDFLELKDTSNTKALGINWNAKADEFSFTSLAPVKIERPTKRQVLSFICKLFDPAG